MRGLRPPEKVATVHSFSFRPVTSSFSPLDMMFPGFCLSRCLLRPSLSLAYTIETHRRTSWYYCRLIMSIVASRRRRRDNYSDLYAVKLRPTTRRRRCSQKEWDKIVVSHTIFPTARKSARAFAYACVNKVFRYFIILRL